MNRKPLLPSERRRGLPFVVPDDWTPDQALAVFELLDDLLAVITESPDQALAVFELLDDLLAVITESPDQALAVFELLDDLHVVITEFYRDPLRELLRAQRRPAAAARATDRDPPF